jgi:hypothetical protein
VTDSVITYWNERKLTAVTATVVINVTQQGKMRTLLTPFKYEL